ncbi:MAG TPA: DUF1444 domain-containing protein [Bacillales bacterium]|nr:DUF1444 domain-containing protein [Bacillales bacterium]
MKAAEMKKTLEARLRKPGRTFFFDREHDKLRVEEGESGKGMTLSLPGLIAKFERNGQAAIDDVVYHVEEGLKAMNAQPVLAGKESKLFPVIRSTSFPTETKSGEPLLHEEHTAETRVYYAVDMEQSYRLIDRRMMNKEQWSEERIRETARFNLRSLPNPVKEDEVAGNVFHFINPNDGYDASRILNTGLLEKMNDEAEGTLTVAVPHQDVLIFGDIRNDAGYDVLGQMTMSFYTSGRVPITALPFVYENGVLEPIFIMARNKPTAGNKGSDNE